MFNRMLSFLVRYLPNSVLNSTNEMTLAELDKRGLIVWADRPHLDQELEASAFELANQFQNVTPDNIPFILHRITQIYGEYGSCVGFRYLIELSAGYFSLAGISEDPE